MLNFLCLHFAYRSVDANIDKGDQARFLVLQESGHFTKQRLISEQLMLWKMSKSRKLHRESLSHIFNQIRLSFDFELYPSLLVAAQTLRRISSLLFAGMKTII